MPPVTVRIARADDEAFVLGLAGRFAESRPAWRAEDEVTAGTAAELRRAFAAPDPGSAIFVAENAGARLGFAYLVEHADFFTREPHGHLSEIATVNDGGGAGHALMAAVEGHVRERGLRFLTLNVNEDNARAHAFYAKLGYVPNTRQLVKVFGTGPGRASGNVPAEA